MLHFQFMLIKKPCSKFATISCNNFLQEFFNYVINNFYNHAYKFYLTSLYSYCRFAKLIENAFSIPFAIQLMISTMSISVSLLQVSYL